MAHFQQTVNRVGFELEGAGVIRGDGGVRGDGVMKGTCRVSRGGEVSSLLYIILYRLAHRA